MSAIIFANI